MLLNSGHRPGIIKSKGQQLKEAERAIKLMEAQAKVGVAQIEELKWMCARYRVSINALAKHFNLTPEQMKEIIQPYFDDEQEAVKKQVESMKEKFKDDLKAGKMPEFTVIENPDIKKEG